MPIVVDAVLVDTSVAVALLVVDHDHHIATTAAVGNRPVGLAGHAAFETYSVLTRLPAPLRRAPAEVATMLSAGFPVTRYLSERGSLELVERLARARIAGGSVYDALVGAVATEHQMVLVTRDHRAARTYQALDVEVELLT